MLRYVKDEFKTPKVCLAAVISNEHAIRFVPEQTDELCYAAVISPENYGHALHWIKNKTPLLCRKAVEMSGTNLMHVPEELQTNELCLIAIKTSPRAIFYVIKPTLEMYELAVSADPSLADEIERPQ